MAPKPIVIKVQSVKVSDEERKRRRQKILEAILKDKDA